MKKAEGMQRADNRRQWLSCNVNARSDFRKGHIHDRLAPFLWTLGESLFHCKTFQLKVDVFSFNLSGCTISL